MSAKNCLTLQHYAVFVRRSMRRSSASRRNRIIHGRKRMSDINDHDSNAASKRAGGLGRRQFLKVAGLAAGSVLAAPAVLRQISVARAADRTEISFASAKFFGKSTV